MRPNPSTANVRSSHSCSPLAESKTRVAPLGPCHYSGAARGARSYAEGSGWPLTSADCRGPRTACVGSYADECEGEGGASPFTQSVLLCSNGKLAWPWHGVSALHVASLCVSRGSHWAGALQFSWTYTIGAEGAVVVIEGSFSRTFHGLFSTGRESKGLEH